ncbi:hypothetical protein T492DRAFT_850117 [Pavlovales sp. CCMP2436]|nr:hypothetical protein T492DRAFT_850117 [Pavlovales sp. CCMP2436]
MPLFHSSRPACSPCTTATATQVEMEVVAGDAQYPTHTSACWRLCNNALRERPRRESDNAYVEFGSPLRERPSLARQLSGKDTEAEKEQEAHIDDIWEGCRAEHISRCRLSVAFNKLRAGPHTITRSDSILSNELDPVGVSIFLVRTRSPFFSLAQLEALHSRTLDVLSGPSNKSYMQRLQAVLSLADAEMLPEPSSNHMSRLQAVLSLAEVEMRTRSRPRRCSAITCR